MKLIVLNDRYVIIEKKRDIDRKNNILNIEYSLEMKYGVAPTHDDDAILVQFPLQIVDMKEDIKQKKLWKEIKDSGRDLSLEKLYEDLQYFLPIERKAFSGELENEDFLKIFSKMNFSGKISFITQWINRHLDKVDLQLIEL